MPYFDHAAATPMYPEVQEALRSLLDKDVGNPSSIHQWGREAKQLIDEARYFVSREFRSELDGVIFTSGATESAHLAIVGSYLGSSLEARASKILVSPLVHKCIWSAVKFLEKHFDVEHEVLPLTKEGFIDTKKTEGLDWSQYALVICEHGNSELGHVQPVAKLGKQIIKYRKEAGSGPLFIVDCAASVVSETVSLEHQKCDLLFFSGEKIGGPSGIGCLVKGEGVTLEPLVSGSHEFGNRGGTENVMGIVGLHKALEVRSKNRESSRETWKKWHEKVRAQISDSRYQVTTPEKDFLPHIIHFIHPEMKADLYVQKADLDGIGLSAGSACSSGTITGSAALQALGYDEEASKRGVRISWGWNTSEEILTDLVDFLL